MLRHCEELTRNGAELKVVWNGGNDNGWFEALLDDKRNQLDEQVERLITDFVDDFVGYGGFAGDFQTDGSVTYNSVTRCFEGTDDYSHSENDILDCEVIVRIPETLWFDSIRVHFEGNELGDIEELSVQLVVNNGPYSDAHAAFEERVSEELRGSLKREIDRIEKDLSSVWEETTTPRSDLEVGGSDLLLIIEEIPYSYYENTAKDIIIPLD